MGLGKTVMTLALILAHPRPGAKAIRKKYFRSTGIAYDEDDDEDEEEYEDYEEEEDA